MSLAVFTLACAEEIEEETVDRFGANPLIVDAEGPTAPIVERPKRQQFLAGLVLGGIIGKAVGLSVGSNYGYGRNPYDNRQYRRPYNG